MTKLYAVVQPTFADNLEGDSIMECLSSVFYSIRHCFDDKVCGYSLQNGLHFSFSPDNAQRYLKSKPRAEEYAILELNYDNDQEKIVSVAKIYKAKQRSNNYSGFFEAMQVWDWTSNRVDTTDFSLSALKVLNKEYSKEGLSCHM